MPNCNLEKEVTLMNLDMLNKQQAEAVGANLGISRSTIHRHIRGDKDDPFTERLKHGIYRKKV